MTVTAKIYGKMFLAALNKEIDWLDDDVRVTLHTSSYTPDQDVDDYVNDLSNEVANGNGYTTGGVALASKTITYSASTNTITLDAADVSWAAASITARTAVVSDRQTGVTSTEPLIGYEQSSSDVTSMGGNFDLVWNASGILTISVA